MNNHVIEFVNIIDANLQNALQTENDTSQVIMQFIFCERCDCISNPVNTSKSDTSILQNFCNLTLPVTSWAVHKIQIAVIYLKTQVLR